MQDGPAQTRAGNPRAVAMLWFAFLGGAIAWTFHLLAAYLVSEFGCIAGWYRYHWLGVSAVAWMLIGVSVLALLIAIAATWLSHRAWQRQSDAAAGQDDAADRTHCFMAGAGRISGLLFIFIILVESIPIVFYLQRC